MHHYFFFQSPMQVEGRYRLFKIHISDFHHFILPSFEDMLQILDKYNRDVELTCFHFSGIGYYK